MRPHLLLVSRPEGARPSAGRTRGDWRGPKKARAGMREKNADWASASGLLLLRVDDGRLGGEEAA